MGGSAHIDGQVFPEFDNFFVAPFEAYGLVWQSAEHLYQALKFKDTTYRREINSCVAAHAYYRMGQSREYQLIDDFENKKANLMFQANWSKITQNKRLGEKLLATRGPIAFYDSTDFWNQTNGRILKTIRERLNKV